MIADLAMMTTGQCTGRALYIGPNQEIYVARRYAVYRSDDWGATWRMDCFVPPRGWMPLVARSRLCARMLRYYIAAFQVLADGTRVAVARDGVYYAGPGDTRMSRSFAVTRGSRPLSLAVDGPRVLFGEYGNGFEAHEVFIYASEDCGRTFDVAHRFPKGDIRHVHTVLVDPYDDHYWVLAGDFGRQPGIATLSKDLKSFDWLCRGGQEHRAASALIQPDCLLYGMDSDCEPNYIMRLDKRSGRAVRVRQVEGSSLFATQFGPVMAVSTDVEPNPACPSRDCAIYASRDGDDWRRVVTHAKDGYHPVGFQYGALALPYACHTEPRGMYSGQAVRGIDDQVVLFKFT